MRSNDFEKCMKNKITLKPCLHYWIHYWYFEVLYMAIQFDFMCKQPPGGYKSTGWHHK